MPDATAEHDDIADTIDYAQVIARIREELAVQQFNLIETLDSSSNVIRRIWCPVGEAGDCQDWRDEGRAAGWGIHRTAAAMDVLRLDHVPTAGLPAESPAGPWQCAGQASALARRSSRALPWASQSITHWGLRPCPVQPMAAVFRVTELDHRGGLGGLLGGGAAAAFLGAGAPFRWLPGRRSRR